MFLTYLVSQRRYDVHYIYPLKQANPQFLRSTFYSVTLRNSLRSLSPKMRRRSNSKESLGMFIEEGRNLTVSRQGRSQESTGLGGGGEFSPNRQLLPQCKRDSSKNFEILWGDK